MDIEGSSGEGKKEILLGPNRQSNRDESYHEIWKKATKT